MHRLTISSRPIFLSAFSKALPKVNVKGTRNEEKTGRDWIPTLRQITGNFVFRLGHPQLEHNHGLLRGIVGILVVDQVQVRIGNFQTFGQGDPVAAEEVANVRQAQIRLHLAFDN